MELIHRKLQAGFKTLHVKQHEAGQRIGKDQSYISSILLGRREFLPTDFINLVRVMGMDLNYLFDDTISEVEFIRLMQGGKRGKPDCSDCKAKEEKISMLAQLADARKVIISNLEHEIKELKGKK